jgi:VCBS repeat-containing protein
MAGLNGETITLKVNYSAFYDEGLVSIDFYTGSFVVGSGVEVSQSFSNTFQGNGFPQNINGTITVDVSDTGYTISFSGQQQPGGITFTFTDVTDQSIATVTGATQTGASGFTPGINQPIAPSFDDDTFQSGFFPLGFQPGVSYSQSVALTFEAAVSAPPTVTVKGPGSVSEGGIVVLGTTVLNTDDADTGDGSLIYTVTNATDNGTLFLDADGNGAVDAGETLRLNSTFTQADVAAGRLKYVHSGDETTLDGFTFSVTDGNSTVSAQGFVINVSGVNDAPVLTGPSLIETEEDTSVVVGGLTVADADAGSGDITVTIEVSGGGDLGAVTGGGVTVGGTGSALTLTGTAGAINAFVGGGNVSFNPSEDSYGTFDLTVTVNDGGNTGSGGALEDSATTQIQINAADDPAVPQDDSFDVSETGVISLENLFADNGNGEDVDVDSTLAVTALNGGAFVGGTPVTLGSGAVLIINTDGTFSYDPNGVFEYLPVGATTTDSFTYELNGEGPAVVTLTISGIDNNDRFEGTDGDDNYLGGVGDDTMDGSIGANTLDGESGNDEIFSGQDAEVLIGGTGEDWLDYGNAASGVRVNLGSGVVSGGAGQDTVSGFERLSGSDFADRLTGFDNSDVLRGGGAGDTLNGGDALDWASYLTSRGSVTVNLNSGAAARGDAAGDVLISIENLVGSALADRLTGDEGRNTIRGMGGADVMNGGDGIDTLDYRQSSGGVVVNLGTGAASGGDAEGDQFEGFENLIGSSFNDSLSGDAGDNVLKGGAGSDRLNGGRGDDKLYGDADSDLFIFNRGNDEAYGGDGADIVQINGNRADYRVITNEDGSRLIRERATGETMLLVDIESAQFDDGLLSFGPI